MSVSKLARRSAAMVDMDQPADVIITLSSTTMVVILPGVVSRNRINCFAHRRG